MDPAGIGCFKYDTRAWRLLTTVAYNWKQQKKTKEFSMSSFFIFLYLSFESPRFKIGPLDLDMFHSYMCCRDVYVVYPMFKTHPQRWPKKPSPEHDVTASERTSLTWVRLRAQICKLNLSWWNCVYRITNISYHILQNHFEGLGICEFFIWPAAVIRKNSSLFCSALQTVVSRGRCSSQTQAWAASLWHLGRRAYSQYGHMMFDGNRLDTHTWQVWSDPLRLQMFAK